MNKKWDIRFLKKAKLVSSWSKDPSTKCGAVITRGKKIVSVGYNSFPEGIKDSESRLNNRDIKYHFIQHAEINAILSAKQDLTGCSLYVVPFQPCSSCAKTIIQAGINRVITIKTDENIYKRWNDSFKFAKKMFKKINLSLIEYDTIK